MTIPTQVAELQIETVDTPDPIDLTSPDGALYFLNPADLRVKYRDPDGNEVDWSYGDDFSISGAGSIGQGVLTPISATVAGGRLCIWRATPLVQEADYEENDGFPAETHERVADRLTLIVQDLRRLISRAVRLCECDPPLDPLPCGTDALAAFGSGIVLAQLTFEADNFGTVIPVGWKRKNNIGFPCTLVAWSIQGDQVGDIAFDVRMKPFATDDPPSLLDSIVGANPPAMTAHSDLKSSNLTDWTLTDLPADTAVEIEITACAAITWVVFNLYLQRGAELP